MNVSAEAAALARVTRRIIPFLFLLYIVAFLDRVNVSFAALKMKGDLDFSDKIYGMGAGIFFIGYFLFEIPSNMYLARHGARWTIALIMVLWGIASTLTAFIRTPFEFYVARFLVGTFEAGIYQIGRAHV